MKKQTPHKLPNAFVKLTGLKSNTPLYVNKYSVVAVKELSNNASELFLQGNHVLDVSESQEMVLSLICH